MYIQAKIPVCDKDGDLLDEQYLMLESVKSDYELVRFTPLLGPTATQAIIDVRHLLAAIEAVRRAT